eukprot:CAMPEP_0194156828 /NCGR_PEP_ID=MMETSP0152-20130528/69699_1 /TAXON_ID=1049557 /ORGANISM="Thalassiothrix antarctica, Strain L6-D1" /LENGTH=261 /DNA_ID=CAMNT_0038864787 /DNA_START=308 /DNA_END=1090 /DNA_ORIENTATION=+
MNFIRDQSLVRPINRIGSLGTKINSVRKIPGMEKLSGIERKKSITSGKSDRSIILSNLENKLRQAVNDFQSFDEQESFYSDSSDSDANFDFLDDGSHLDILREELDKADIEYGIPPPLGEYNVSTDTEDKNKYSEQLLEEETSQSTGCQYEGEGTMEGFQEKTEADQHNTQPLSRFNRRINRRSSSIISALSPISEGSGNSDGSESLKSSIGSWVAQDNSLLDLCLDINGMNKEMIDSIEEKLKHAGIPDQQQFVYKQFME